MYALRLWIGSIFFAIGVIYWVAFLRTLRRPILQKPVLFNRNKFIIIFWNLFWVIAGLLIYPIPKTIPLLGLIFGIIVGWYISRPSKHRRQQPEEDFMEE